MTTTGTSTVVQAQNWKQLRKNVLTLTTSMTKLTTIYRKIFKVKTKSEACHPSLSQEMISIGLNRIVERARELNLNVDGPRTHITGQDGVEGPGNDRAKQASLDRYETAYNSGLQLGLLLGLYDDCIILYRKMCPKDTPPVGLYFARLVLQYYSEPPGKVLTCPDNPGCPVLDVFGNQVPCVGAWRSMTTIKQWQSALSKLHSHYDNCKGPYEELCVDCCAHGGPCTRHAIARTWRKGDPSQDPQFRTYCENCAKRAHEFYKATRSSFAYTPSEVRELRWWLLQECTDRALMMWTIIVVSIKIFLRIHEALDIMVEDFVPRMFIQDQETEGVKGLCLKVQGKTDTVPKYFYLWRDHECPEFDACVATLIWVYYTKRESGYLFPRLAQIKSPATTEPWAYKSALSYIKSISAKYLHKEVWLAFKKGIIYGTHILRKTAFLFAWCGSVMFTQNLKQDALIESAILNAARHKWAKSTAVYLGDAGTLMELFRTCHPDAPEQKVPTFRSVHIDNLPAMEDRVLPFDNPGMTLLQFATWYVEEFLGVKYDRECDNIRSLYRKVTEKEMERQRVQKSPGLQETLALVTNPELREQLRRVIQQVRLSDRRTLSEQLSTAAANETVIGDNTPPRTHTTAESLASNQDSGASQSPASPDTALSPAITRITPRGSSVQFHRDYPKEWKSHAAQKSRSGFAAACQVCIEFCASAELQLENQGKKWGTKLPSDSVDMKTAYYRAKSVAHCINECYNGDADAFVTDGNVPKVTFNNSECKKGVVHKSQRSTRLSFSLA
jgi:hypothetical protein